MCNLVRWRVPSFLKSCLLALIMYFITARPKSNLVLETFIAALLYDEVIEVIVRVTSVNEKILTIVQSNQSAKQCFEKYHTCPEKYALPLCPIPYWYLQCKRPFSDVALRCCWFRLY